MSPLLNVEIIEARKKYAPKLKSLLEKIEKIFEYFESIKKNADGIDCSLPNIDLTINLVKELKQRIHNTHNRFSKGEITISIAGLEKAGKSTFINNLLKSRREDPDIITTAASRCTSVPINIRYGQEKKIEIEYYQSYKSFFDEVINPLIEDGYNKEIGSEAPIPLFSNLETFKAYDFKKINVAQGSLASIVFEKLIGYQNNLAEIKETIGKAKVEEQGISKLAEYSAHLNISEKQKAHQACIRECTVVYPFDGGSQHLKLADTPGVDDPSPNARSRTLATISNLTDLLVVLSKPDNKPDLTDSHTRFYDSISKLNQKNAFPLRNKSCVIVNRTELGDDADAKKHEEIVQTHIINLKKWENVRVFDEHFCLCDKEQALSAFGKINMFLKDHLQNADRHEVEMLHVDFKNILKTINDAIGLWERKLPKDQSDPDYILAKFNHWSNAFREHLRFALGRARINLKEEEFILKAKSYSQGWLSEIKNVINGLEAVTEKLLEDEGTAHGTGLPIDRKKRDLEEKLRNALKGFSGKDVSDFISDVETYIFNLCFPMKFSSPSGESISYNLRNKINFENIERLVDLVESKAVSYSTGNDFSSFTSLITSLREISSDSDSGILRYSLRPAFALLNPTITERNDAFKRFISDYKAENERLSNYHSAGVFNFSVPDSEKRKFKYYSFEGEIADSKYKVILENLDKIGLFESFPAVQFVTSFLTKGNFESKQSDIPAQTRELVNIRIGSATENTLCTKISVKKSGDYHIWIKYSCTKNVGKVFLNVKELSADGGSAKFCLENFEIDAPSTKKHEALSWMRLNVAPIVFNQGRTYRFEFFNNKDDVNFSGVRLEFADATALEDEIKSIENEPGSNFKAQIREFSILKKAIQRYFEILMQRQEFNYVEIAEDYIAALHLQLTSRDDSKSFAALLGFFRSHRDVLCCPDVDQSYNTAVTQIHSDIQRIRSFCV